MKGSLIQQGMLVQILGTGYKARDDVDREFIVAEVLDTGLVETRHVLLPGEPHRLPDGTRLGNAYKPATITRPSDARFAVRVLREIKRYDESETWREPSRAEVRLVRSADVVRIWTPEVEETLLRQRRETRERLAAAKEKAAADVAAAAARENEAREELARLVGGVDRLPGWMLHHDKTLRPVEVQRDGLSWNAAGKMSGRDVLAVVRAALAQAEAGGAAS